ncbi:MAG: flagellar hook-basal body complex protein [Oscillospiraceae bacterium]|nr:flagellar hook-basal body complex protein [Oscillospiraceae bacterium]
MVKSLYSGVAGLKSQQTKMDVIGNNIANVGTYGYKSSRATFKDVYYQTQTAATAATGNIGGTNAKQVGYGNSVSSIDTNTQTSAMSATGYNLDIAIAGEGFLQVMGMDGKIMYTKAGMLDIDAEGNLVDVNGNFVLGSAGDVTGPPASDKINISLPFLDPQNAEVTETINNVSYEITASNFTNKGNVNFSFAASAALPVGQKMTAKVSGSSINVTLNSYEYFKDMDEFNSYLNQAITDALGGSQHPAGTFTITSSDESMFKAPLSPIDKTTGKALGVTGAEIVSSNFGYQLGDAGYISGNDTANALKNLFSISAVNSGFQGDTRLNAGLDNSSIMLEDESMPAGMSISFDEDGLKVIVGSTGSVDPVTHKGAESAVYVGEITYNQLNAPGEVILRRVDMQTTLKAVNKALTDAGDTTSQTAISDAQKVITAAEKDLADKKKEAEKADATQADKDAYVQAQKDLVAANKAYNDLVVKLANARNVISYSSDETDSLLMNYPEYTSVKNVYQQINAAESDLQDDLAAIESLRKGTAAPGTVVTLDAGNILNLSHSEPTRSLGLGQKSFSLKGGTEGGEQTVANLTAISINSDGIIVGVHDVYGVCELGRVDLATFANPAGLTKVGSTYFEESLNSGEPIIVNAGTEGTGEIMASTLEASNVDLSSEFSDMIMTQRGFQASSRVITVSDTMLEELINLKR